MVSPIIIYTLIIILFLLIVKQLTKYEKIIIKYVLPFLSWRIIVCYLPFWFIFTGWTYVAVAIGNTWWKTVASSWLAWMFMPWCPEKLITIPATIWLHKKIFPRHSTAELDKLLADEKENWKKRKSKK